MKNGCQILNDGMMEKMDMSKNEKECENLSPIWW